MNVFFVIYRSDLADDYDKPLCRRQTQEEARQEARRLNRLAVAQRGRNAPLFYVVKMDDAGRTYAGSHLKEN